MDEASNMAKSSRTWEADRHTTEEILVNLLSVGFRDEPDIG